MKKDKRTKFCGALLVAGGFATILWAALIIGGDNLARPNTKAPISKKQAIFKEFCPSDPEYIALGFLGAITTLAGIGLINKKEK